MNKKLSVTQLLKQYMMLIVLVAIIVLGTILTGGILI